MSLLMNRGSLSLIVKLVRFWKWLSYESAKAVDGNDGVVVASQDEGGVVEEL